MTSGDGAGLQPLKAMLKEISPAERAMAADF